MQCLWSKMSLWYTENTKLYRGSYMSAHVLLNLLNELGKRDEMRGLPSNLSLFRNEFNKFNNTRERILDSIYHMTNTLKSDFWRKNVIILSLCTQRCYGRHNVSRKGAQWLSGRVLDSRPKGRGFEPHRRHCVVVLEQNTFILGRTVPHNWKIVEWT